MSNSEIDPYPIAFRLGSALKFAGSLGAARENIRSYEAVWLLFAGCIILGNVRFFAGEFSGPLDYMIAYGGSAGCAWGWLFARTLFRPDAALTKWPLFLLVATVLFEGSWEITRDLSAPGEARRLIANGASFLCISMIALVFVEALSGFNRRLSAAERRFRRIFVGFFCAALGVMMFWTLNAPEGSLAAQSQAPARLAFGLLAIIGGRCAVEFRKKNPVAAATAAARQKPRGRALDPACADLADRVRNALENEQLFATPKLKVSDLSLALGEPEYKVTQCITSAMGYQNFNRLVNAYRIEYAKAALRDRDNGDRQILAIALECGFNSIGPFNRAFKQEVGMTPRRYRAAQH